MSSNNKSTTATKAGSQSADAKAKRAATVMTNREQRIKERGYSLPLELTCTVTGKTVRYTSPTYIDKCISRYGTLEKLQKNFISREGKRINAEKAKAAAPAKVAKVAKVKTVKAPKAVAPSTPAADPAAVAAPAVAATA